MPDDPDDIDDLLKDDDDDTTSNDPKQEEPVLPKPKSKLSRSISSGENRFTLFDQCDDRLSQLFVD